MTGRFLANLRRAPLSAKEQGLFAERLALLLGASLSLPEAIAALAGAFGKRSSASFAALGSSLESGKDFERALAESPLRFGRMLVLAARIGEKSGTLGESLEAAARRIERRRTAQAGLVSALTYPAVIFLASAGIISFLVFFIMPKIIPTLESLGVPLPAVTRFFIAASHAMADDWWKALVLAMALAAPIAFLYRRSMTFKAFTQRRILGIPLVSDAVRAHILADLFDVMSTLVSTGCPFIEATGESAAFIGFMPYKKALADAIEKMRSGSDFSSVLGRYPSLFPALAVQSLSVGERTGHLEAVLAQISRYYARELESAIGVFSKLIEPALMIGVGCIVGSAALSIVLPVYGISQHLSG